MGTLPPVRPPEADTGPVPEFAGSEADCRTCRLRTRCITWGWRSPGGLWFENAVVLRPAPGCRGWIGRGPEIRRRFADS